MKVPFSPQIIEPLERIYLHTTAIKDLTPSGIMKTIYNLLAIVIIAMVLALSNFINLYILNGAYPGFRKHHATGIL